MGLVPFTWDSFEESGLHEFTESPLHERIGSGGTIAPSITELAFRAAYLWRTGIWPGTDYGDTNELFYDAYGLSRRFLRQVVESEWKLDGATVYKTRRTNTQGRYAGLDGIASGSDVLEVLVGTPPAPSTSGEIVSLTENWSGSLVYDYYLETAGGWVVTIKCTYSEEWTPADMWTEVLGLYAEAEWSDGSDNYCVTKDESGAVVYNGTLAGSGGGPRASTPGFHYDGILDIFCAVGRRYLVRAHDWYLDRLVADYAGKTVGHSEEIQGPLYGEVVDVEPDGMLNIRAVLGTAAGSDSAAPSSGERPYSDASVE